MDFFLETGETSTEDCRIPDMGCHNTFDEPEQVKEKEFAIDRIAGEEGKLYFTVPACSILHLEVERA